MVATMSIAFLVVLVLGLLVLAGVVAGVLGLTSGRQGWLVALLVVAGLAGFLVLGFLSVFAVRVTPASPTSRVTYRAAQPAVVVQSAPNPSQPPDKKPAVDRVIVELAAGSAEAPAGESSKKASSVLRILANALLKAIEEEEAASANSAQGPAPASKAPAGGLAAPSDRPAWVGSDPHLSEGVYQVAVVVGPYLTREECESKLPEEVQKAIADYVDLQIGPEASRRIQLPWDYVEGHLLKARWEERKEYSVGPMLRLHVLVGFDRQATQRIRQEWDNLIVQRRVWTLASSGAVLLLTLSVIYAYLKIDLATGGRYRGRLRLAAGTALVLLIALGMWSLRL